MAIRFRCLYDGTEFHGFQQQVGLVTVQGTLQRTFEELLGPGKVIGAGRTDRGVHAQGQVVVWRGESAIPIERLVPVLNRRLPESIQLSHATVVDDAWDPIRCALGKRYTYRLWRCRSAALPWLRYTYAMTAPLSWERLQESADMFLGTHDFRAFRGEGSSAKTTIRTVSTSRWLKEESGSIWCYQVQADGFLYHMVRMMVGAMLEDALVGPERAVVGRGLADPRGPKVSGPVPASGLTLEEILYA